MKNRNKKNNDDIYNNDKFPINPISNLQYSFPEAKESENKVHHFY